MPSLWGGNIIMTLKRKVIIFWKGLFFDYTRKRWDYTLPFIRLWFAPIRFIEWWNWKDREYDIEMIDGVAHFVKPKPFLRLIVRRAECAMYENKWWHNIEIV